MSKHPASPVLVLSCSAPTKTGTPASSGASMGLANVAVSAESGQYSGEPHRAELWYGRADHRRRGARGSFQVPQAIVVDLQCAWVGVRAGDEREGLVLAVVDLLDGHSLPAPLRSRVM